MDAGAAIAIGGLVAALAQVTKWAGLRDTWGPLVLIFLSAASVTLWVYSKGVYDRTLLFDYVVGAANVMLTSAGIFGFTRSLPAAVTEGSRNSSIPGAGQSLTSKPNDSQEERRGQ